VRGEFVVARFDEMRAVRPHQRGDPPVTVLQRTDEPIGRGVLFDVDVAVFDAFAVQQRAACV
jgi:hypothetical protein